MTIRMHLLVEHWLDSYLGTNVSNYISIYTSSVCIILCLIYMCAAGAYRVAVGLRAAVGMGIVLGITKFRNGTYLPPLIPQEESYEVRRTKRLD